MNNTNENVDKTVKAEQLNKMADMLGLSLFNISLVHRHFPEEYQGKPILNEKED